jgi:predicted CopG family antitoxin
MFSSNQRYKQILVTIENYDELKEIGQMWDPFNQVIHKLISRYKEGGKL